MQKSVPHTVKKIFLMKFTILQQHRSVNLSIPFTLSAKHLSNVCLLNYFVGRSSEKTKFIWSPKYKSVHITGNGNLVFARQKSPSFNQKIALTQLQHAVTSLGLYPRLQHSHTWQTHRCHCSTTTTLSVTPNAAEGFTGHRRRRGDNTTDSLNKLTYLRSYLGNLKRTRIKAPDTPSKY